MWKMQYYSRRFDSPAAYALIALMVVVFLVDFFTENRFALLLAWSPTVAWLRSGPYWQPVTFPFAQMSVFSLLFSGVCLYWFGSSLERAWGTAKFLFFFFSVGILAGLVLMPQTAYAPTMPLFAGMVASFSAIAVAFGSMNPYAPVMFWFVPMQARVMALIIVGFELFLNYGSYGGPLQAVMAIGVVSLYAYMFTTRRVSLPNLGGGRGHGPSMKERFDRWQQRRKMRQWQRRVSKIDRPDDLFKDK